MKRTTILADEALLLEAQALADRQGKTLTAVVREALAEYVAAHQPARRRFRSIASGRSGDGTIAERAEEILYAEAGPNGWEPSRSAASPAGRRESRLPKEARAEPPDVGVLHAEAGGRTRQR